MNWLVSCLSVLGQDQSLPVFNVNPDLFPSDCEFFPFAIHLTRSHLQRRPSRNKEIMKNRKILTPTHPPHNLKMVRFIIFVTLDKLSLSPFVRFFIIFFLLEGFPFIVSCMWRYCWQSHCAISPGRWKIWVWQPGKGVCWEGVGFLNIQMLRLCQPRHLIRLGFLWEWIAVYIPCIYFR